MTNSGTSTNAGQFFLLLSMVGAIGAVAFARDTHPVALLLLSGAVLAAGLVGFTVHRALSGFFGGGSAPAPVKGTLREDLEREKALALRSIKELEFDHAMGKVAEADFTELRTRLRARALEVMEALEGAPQAPPATEPVIAAVSPASTPSTALGAGPSAALGAGPSAALGAGPSTVLGAGPSTALGAGPSTALGAGPSTALGAGDATTAQLCAACQTENDGDARFCKQCGGKLGD